LDKQAKRMRDKTTRKEPYHQTGEGGKGMDQEIETESFPNVKTPAQRQVKEGVAARAGWMMEGKWREKENSRGDTLGIQKVRQDKAQGKGKVHPRGVNRDRKSASKRLADGQEELVVEQGGSEGSTRVKSVSLSEQNCGGQKKGGAIGPERMARAGPRAEEGGRKGTGRTAIEERRGVRRLNGAK